jgi:hypothetical protein
MSGSYAILCAAMKKKMREAAIKFTYRENCALYQIRIDNLELVNIYIFAAGSQSNDP